MFVIKIKSGKIYIYNERNILYRSFGKDIAVAFFNNAQDSIVATLLDGSVKTMTLSGHLKRVVKNKEAVDARYFGDDILINLKNGKSEIRTESGLLKRTIT